MPVLPCPPFRHLPTRCRPDGRINGLTARRLLGTVATAGLLLVFSQVYAGATDIERGGYLVHAGGCISCHTADDEGGGPLAGGDALVTAFGTFYAPNITPDAETGIGTWSDEDFLRAMHEGSRPDGAHYYPVFPYTAYAGLTIDDVMAIKAYLFSLPPIRQRNRAHELPWYLSSRLAAGAWKLLFFTAERFMPDASRAAPWNRGAYLVHHLGHCGECHTPRNVLGVTDSARELAGNPAGPDGKKVPDITANRDTGIGRWSVDEIEFFLELGMLPDGDFTGGAMSSVIDDNTSHLSAADRHAIATYLRSLPAAPAGDNSGS